MSTARQWAIEPALSADVAPLHRLRRQLEDWLHDKGVRQWPRGEVRPETIAAQIDRGEWHLIRHPELDIAAAMRVLWSDPDFWGADDVPAVYVHGLMVDRAVAGYGVGRRLLDWAGERGRERGAVVFRLDCAESNQKLRTFYRKQGFREVGRRDFATLFSVTLFEKRL